MHGFWTDARVARALSLFPHTDGRDCSCACTLGRIMVAEKSRFWVGRTAVPTVLERLALNGLICEMYERSSEWQSRTMRWLRDEERLALKGKDDGR